MIGGKDGGLVQVRDEHLVEVLRAVHRGDLACPFDAKALAIAGFLGISDSLAHLRGLDRAAVIAVITAVLAERRARARAPGATRGPSPS